MADRVDEILEHFGNIPEVRWLAARVRQLEAPARRVVDFTRQAWRPPGRLGALVDSLGAAVDDNAFDIPPVDPTRWDEVQWRRRALELYVPHSILLQRAHELAIAAGVPTPKSLGEIPTVIAADLVAELEELGVLAARNKARKVVGK